MSDYLVGEWNHLAEQLDAIAETHQQAADSMRLRAEYARDQARQAKASW